jgi:hypothetical protein
VRPPRLYGRRRCTERHTRGLSCACDASAVSTCVSRLCSIKSVKLLGWASANGLRLSYRHYSRSCEEAIRSGNVAALEWLLEHDTCVRNLAAMACHKAARRGRVSPTVRRAYKKVVSSGSLLRAVHLLRTYGVSDDEDGYGKDSELGTLYHFLSRLHTASDAAAREEHTGVLLLLRSHLPNLSAGRKHTSCAAQEGRLDDLKELYAKGYGISSYAYDVAARSNRMDIVVWLRKAGVEGNWGQRETSEAAAEGDALKLQQLHASGYQVSHRCWAQAARGGHLSVFETLQSLGIVDAEPRCTGEAAARGGHLHLVKWLFMHHDLELTAEIFQLAAGGGSIEMLKCLRENGCPWSNCAYSSAMSSSRLDTLQWLQAEGCPLTEESDGAGGFAGLVSMAAAHADLTVLKELLAQGAVQLSAHDTEAAAKHGHLDALKLLHEFHCPMNEGACAAAAGGNHLEVLQWLRLQGCPWDGRTAACAVACYNLQMLQWIVEQGAPWNPEQCFNQAGVHTAVAEWIRDNYLTQSTNVAVASDGAHVVEAL